jgi:putative peptidoglycan binding protein
MRTFFVLICTFVLICAAGAGNKSATSAKASQHSPAKTSHHNPVKTSPHTPAKSPQHVPTRSSNEVSPQNQNPVGTDPHVQRMQTHQHGLPATANPVRIPLERHGPQNGQPVNVQHQGDGSQNAAAVRFAPPPLTKEQQAEAYAQSQGFRSAEQFNKWQHSGRVDAPTGVAASGRPANQHRIATPASGIYPSPKTPATFAERHYELPKTAVPPNEKVTFHPGNHIPGCHDWRDSRYDVFRNYMPTWQDKHWWISHHRRIVLVFGGWYYWNSSYWYPAWGYHPDAVYAYDGPIYAYHNQLPDQVVANVQAALQELGYYHGPINGVLGLETREAIANYQRDHGLYTTSTIDEVTIEALGMT